MSRTNTQTGKEYLYFVQIQIILIPSRKSNPQTVGVYVPSRTTTPRQIHCWILFVVKRQVNNQQGELVPFHYYDMKCGTKYRALLTTRLTNKHTVNHMMSKYRSLRTPTPPGIIACCWPYHRLGKKIPSITVLCLNQKRFTIEPLSSDGSYPRIFCCFTG